MGRYVASRIIQAVFTVLGVMLLTFILLNLVAGDVSAQYVNPKLGKPARDAWMTRHGLDLPVWRPDTPRFWEGRFWDTQFFHHLRNSVTFQARSYRTDEKLTTIIAQRSRYSLALTVPGTAVGWLLGLAISSVVAYYRGRIIDRAGVLLAVLGMCIPFLAYMMGAQALLFRVLPEAAWGLRWRANIYVPILAAVVAGLGANVRFYRTVILDEVRRDYVRTAVAKGVGLPSILFGHVLKNCMLPILTNLVATIPYLIMGALLLESFFGIPGLGDLMVASITDRDVPIITGLVFLTAVLNVLAYLVTDILYGLLDPRIRLR